MTLMRAADVMDTRVDVADRYLDAEEAWAHMRTHDLQSLVITDGERIVGLVSRARLDGSGGKAHRRGRTVAQYLPPGPITVGADYPLPRVIAMLEGDVSGCVPVLEHGRLVGVLTVAGLLRRLGMRDARSRAS